MKTALSVLAAMAVMVGAGFHANVIGSEAAAAALLIVVLVPGVWIFAGTIGQTPANYRRKGFEQ